MKRRGASNLIAYRDIIVSAAADYPEKNSEQIEKSESKNQQVKVGGKDQIQPVTDLQSLRAKKFLCDQDMNRLMPYLIYERHVLIKMVENNYKFFHDF